MATAPHAMAVGGRATPDGRWWAGALACTLAGVALLAPVAAVLVGAAEGLGWKSVLAPWLLLLPGALLAVGRPRSALGWLMLSVALLFGLSALAAALVGRGLDGPEVAWAVWFVDRGSAIIVPLTLAILLLVPDGRLPSPAWRWPALLAVGAQVAVVIAWSTAAGPAAAPDGDLTGAAHLANPVGILPPAAADVATSLEPVLQGLLLLAVPAVGWRVLRGAPGERRRVATLLAAVVVFAVLVVLGRMLWPAAADVLDVIGCALLAAALTSAVLTRRLPGVDVVIGHAVVYALLTALVAGVYVLAVALLGRWGAGMPAPAAGVVSAAVALALMPARGALQRVVDRALLGDTTDAVAAIRRLSASAAGSADLDDLLESVARTVQSSVRASAVTVTADGRTATVVSQRPGGAAHREELVVRGRPHGELVVTYPTGRRVVARDRELLRDFADHVARVVDTARLADELRESRELLVTAREEERLRLRRDLHDELGPTLAGLRMELAGLGDVIRRDPETARRRTAHLEDSARTALEQVRTVSRGLRPPALDELGLLGSVADVAQRCHVPLVVDAEDLPPLTPALEVAAYRVAAEAITNVSRHARGCEARLDVRATRGELVLRVVDTGPGRGSSPSGVGTLAMRERAEELGGSLVIEETPGGGTTVEARFPLPVDGEER